jgi:hypothetical protein
MTPPLSPAAAAFHDAILAITGKSGGVLTVETLHHDDASALVDLAKTGDSAALTKCWNIARLLRQIDAAPPGNPCRCASCEQPVRSNTPFHIAMIRPDCPPPCPLMAIAVCLDCARDTAGIKRAAQTLIEQIWDGVRPLQISNQKGRA